MIAYFAARGERGEQPEEQSGKEGEQRGTKHKEGVRHFSGVQGVPTSSPK